MNLYELDTMIQRYKDDDDMLYILLKVRKKLVNKINSFLPKNIRGMN